MEEVTLPSEKIKIDQVLLQSGVRLTKEYLENTYGVQVEESVPEPVTQKKSPTTQNSTVNSELIAIYTATDLALQDDTPSFVVPIEAWLRKIFAGTQETIDSKSAQAVMRYLIQAVEKGYGKTLVSLPFGEQAYTLLAELQYNAGLFAALKNHVQMRDLVRQLRDERGRLRSFREFRGVARTINEQYNQQWLRAEYNAAVGAARSAAQWQQHLETKERYPNLKYVAVHDERTRQSHRIWDGFAHRAAILGYALSAQ